jgi:hypothetical protein
MNHVRYAVVLLLLTVVFLFACPASAATQADVERVVQRVLSKNQPTGVLRTVDAGGTTYQVSFAANDRHYLVTLTNAAFMLKTERVLTISIRFSEVFCKSFEDDAASGVVVRTANTIMPTNAALTSNAECLNKERQEVSFSGRHGKEAHMELRPFEQAEYDETVNTILAFYEGR